MRFVILRDVCPQRRKLRAQLKRVAHPCSVSDVCLNISAMLLLFAQGTVKASKSPVKRALMLRAPSSQAISEIASLQREKTQLCEQMNQARVVLVPCVKIKVLTC